MTITRIRKTTAPTAYDPPTTTLPNASITCPAAPAPSWPCSRMVRVAATLSASRKSVTTSSTDGNVENASGSRIVSPTIRTRSAVEIDTASRRSSRIGGSGTSSTSTTPTSASGTSSSAAAPNGRRGGIAAGAVMPRPPRASAPTRARRRRRGTVRAERRHRAARSGRGRRRASAARRAARRPRARPARSPSPWPPSPSRRRAARWSRRPGSAARPPVVRLREHDAAVATASSMRPSRARDAHGGSARRVDRCRARAAPRAARSTIRSARRAASAHAQSPDESQPDDERGAERPHASAGQVRDAGARERRGVRDLRRQVREHPRHDRGDQDRLRDGAHQPRDAFLRRDPRPPGGETDPPDVRQDERRARAPAGLCDAGDDGHGHDHDEERRQPGGERVPRPREQRHERRLVRRDGPRRREPLRQHRPRVRDDDRRTGGRRHDERRERGRRSDLRGDDDLALAPRVGTTLRRGGLGAERGVSHARGLRGSGRARRGRRRGRRSDPRGGAP